MTERSFWRGASDSEYTLAPSGQRRSNVDKARERRSPPSSRSRNTGAREAFQSQMGLPRTAPRPWADMPKLAPGMAQQVAGSEAKISFLEVGGECCSWGGTRMERQAGGFGPRFVGLLHGRLIKHICGELLHPELRQTKGRFVLMHNRVSTGKGIAECRRACSTRS